MTISDIHFKNFSGTTSSKEEPYVGTLVCSGPSVSSIRLSIDTHLDHCYHASVESISLTVKY